MEKLKRSQGGNWVDGDRFWGRDAELVLLTEYLDEGANVLMVAQRRIGKTSIMREAIRRLQDRYICLFVDLQSANSIPDAVVELSAATFQYDFLWHKTKNIFSNIINKISDKIDSLQIDEIKVTLRAGLTGGDWRNKGDELFDILSQANRPVLVFMDEVPILVNRLLKGYDYQITPERRQEVDAFMSWLRENSTRHKGKVRIIIAGSIGLEPILQQAGLSATINNLLAFELKPWDRQTAAGCLEALANEYGLSYQPQATSVILDHIGICIPYHVQLFFDHLYRLCRLRQIKEISSELVAEVYENDMLSVRGHAELSHNEERLKLVLGPELHLLALDLLTETAVKNRLSKRNAELIAAVHFPDISQQKSELLKVLNILQHDGFLQRDKNSYIFVSKLLQDWWKARFGFHYVPIAQRGS